MMPCSNAYGGPALPSCKRKDYVKHHASLHAMYTVPLAIAPLCVMTWQDAVASQPALNRPTILTWATLEATHHRNGLVAIEAAAFEFIGAGQLRYERASLWRLIPE